MELKCEQINIISRNNDLLTFAFSERNHFDPFRQNIWRGKKASLSWFTYNFFIFSDLDL